MFGFFLSYFIPSNPTTSLIWVIYLLLLTVVGTKVFYFFAESSVPALPAVATLQVDTGYAVIINTYWMLCST